MTDPVPGGPPAQGRRLGRHLVGRGHAQQPLPRPVIGAEPAPSLGLGEAAAREGERVARRGAIREVVFGAQDGLTSNLALLAGVSGASVTRGTVLVAGLAGLVGGAISMAVGAYVSTKSQRDVYAFELDKEREQLRSRFFVERMELGEILVREGLDPQAARTAAYALSTNEGVMLKTMAEKELGIPYEAASSPLTDAAVMGASFVVGAAIPLLGLLVHSGVGALVVAALLTLAALFLIGVAKARLAGENPWRSGVEIALLAGAGAAVAYGLGKVLPPLFGVHASGVVGG